MKCTAWRLFLALGLAVVAAGARVRRARGARVVGLAETHQAHAAAASTSGVGSLQGVMAARSSAAHGLSAFVTDGDFMGFCDDSFCLPLRAGGCGALEAVAIGKCTPKLWQPGAVGQPITYADFCERATARFGTSPLPTTKTAFLRYV